MVVGFSRDTLYILPRRSVIPHSCRGLGCLKGGVSYSSTVSLPVNQEWSTPLLERPDFWCECGIRHEEITILRSCTFKSERELGHFQRWQMAMAN